MSKEEKEKTKSTFKTGIPSTFKSKIHEGVKEQVDDTRNTFNKRKRKYVRTRSFEGDNRSEEWRSVQFVSPR